MHSTRELFRKWVKSGHDAEVTGWLRLTHSGPKNRSKGDGFRWRGGPGASMKLIMAKCRKAERHERSA
jgi:hypothetical protein